MLLSHNTPAQSLENKAAKSEKNAPLLEKKVLSLEGARKMAEAAINEAEKNHRSGVVAIVDDRGWLILLELVRIFPRGRFLLSVIVSPAGS
jgi:hypothetical protein